LAKIATSDLAEIGEELVVDEGRRDLSRSGLDPRIDAEEPGEDGLVEAV
jgi:hypothetical protein